MYILDCTLRDGGYYNNWDFPPEVVTAYLEAMAAAKIDYVELGLRNFPKNNFDGPFAYTTESYINSLILPDGPCYGVMVDAKTILTADMSVSDAVDALFVDAAASKVKMVRIAAHFHEVEKSEKIVLELKRKGYKVGYNLMQAGGKSCTLISEMANLASKWDGLDVLYFADSLGNMDATEVTRIIKAIRQEWQGELGIHTHNNMAKALDNSLTAQSLGVLWLDATITGMGRGAGNAQTESLLAMLDVDQSSSYNPTPVYELVIRHFDEMQKKYGWGSNLLYFLGAQNDVHPTYIQNLLSNKHYGTDEIIGAISYLSELEGTTAYNGEVLKHALSFNSSRKPVSGSKDLCNKFSGKEVLIVGNGPSLPRYKSAIESYIKERKPVVIAINAINTLCADYIDYYCVSHNTKFLSEHNIYKKLQKPLILPTHRFSSDELRDITSEYVDYGLDVTANKFTVNDEFCVIPTDITIAYALSIAKNADAKKISLVGVDGYESGDIRQIEMLDLLLKFSTVSSQQLTALTPTNYPIEQTSVYAPNL